MLSVIHLNLLDLFENCKQRLLEVNAKGRVPSSQQHRYAVLRDMTEMTHHHLVQAACQKKPFMLVLQETTHLNLRTFLGDQYNLQQTWNLVSRLTNQSIQSQSLSENEDQDHTHEQLWLLSISPA